MGKILAMGGQENPKLFKFCADLIEREEKHLVFVGTASNDSEGYFNSVKGIGEKLGFESRQLSLLSHDYTKEEFAEIIDWGDLMYVSGGDTFMMVKVWLEKGFDKVLRDAYDNDRLILSGSSAGGICWFKKGFSDAAREPIDELCKTGWVNGLGWFDYAFCPHFASRRTDFERAMKNCEVDGIGLEDSTAVFIDNGSFTFLKSEESLTICTYRNTPEGVVTEIQKGRTL